MFFEGAEKRIIISFNKSIKHIYDKNWWENNIKNIGCSIISMISNNYYDIYLLSESILLVSDKYLLIKTCGTTSPLHILYLLDTKLILNINYSHPNFLKTYEQPLMYQNPNDIMKFIQNYLDLPLIYKKLLFLNTITNNIYMEYNEIILWDFICNDKFISIIKNAIYNWHLDDYHFDPQGYSLNGCNNEEYITIHCTPNKECSYISIEYKGNIDINIFQDILNILNPNKLGIISNDNKLINLKINKNYDFIYVDNFYIKYYS